MKKKAMFTVAVLLALVLGAAGKFPVHALEIGCSGVAKKKEQVNMGRGFCKEIVEHSNEGENISGGLYHSNEGRDEDGLLNEIMKHSNENNLDGQCSYYYRSEEEANKDFERLLQGNDGIEGCQCK
ncbi:MAG: hypothetical protein LBH47_01655 [Christensenellaceae bacterium]|jgi:hypothetical protein|nr:hypothetical protein [Christensenellaceae bacterium]